MSDCPCGSKESLESCCLPYLKGEAFPETAEKLMRSRYTAFTRADMDYIHKTLAPKARKGFDPVASKKSAEAAKWKGLKILSTKAGGPDDTEGVVEFTALYQYGEETVEHHEVSEFERNDKGHWHYVDGDAHTHKEGESHQHHERPETVVRQAPKIGRNDPCHCGSGRKYKKCCEAKSL